MDLPPAQLFPTFPYPQDTLLTNFEDCLNTPPYEAFDACGVSDPSFFSAFPTRFIFSTPSYDFAMANHAVENMYQSDFLPQHWYPGCQRATGQEDETRKIQPPSSNSALYIAPDTMNTSSPANEMPE